MGAYVKCLCLLNEWNVMRGNIMILELLFSALSNSDDFKLVIILKSEIVTQFHVYIVW